MSRDAQITALAPWFGGKRNLAPRIIRELGDHRVYWEPFCGSMAILLIKPPCVMETVCDLHGDLTNLARVVQDEALALKLYALVSRSLMAESLFEDSAAIVRKDIVSDEPDLERAYHYFVVAWLGRNGVAGTASYNHHFCVRYTSKGGHAAKRWMSAAESLPAWHQRLRNVTILRRDAFDVLPRIEDIPGTVIYVDPPYIEKGALYVHDFGKVSAQSQDVTKATEMHKRLADELCRFRAARVVVSYYAHKMLDGLYPDWTRVDIEVSKALAHQGQRGANTTKATEVLLINGPSCDATDLLF